MRTNVKRETVAPRTHNGARGSVGSNLEQLRRLVLNTLLYEENFYTSASSTWKSIATYMREVPGNEVINLILWAKKVANIRSTPLRMAIEALQIPEMKPQMAHVIYELIDTTAEVSEMVAMYFAANGGFDERGKPRKVPLANQLKTGLAMALTKFDAYQLAKDSSHNKVVTLKDVFLMTHPKPLNGEKASIYNGKFGRVLRHADGQGRMWKDFLDGKLPAPKTWEVELSTAAARGVSKRDAWTEMLKSGRMPWKALLMNLRNMDDEKVEDSLVKSALSNAKAHRALPFEFIRAARACPRYRTDVENLMLQYTPRGTLSGLTVILVDVSGSMAGPVASYTSRGTRVDSSLSRMDAASAMAMYLREVCEDAAVFSFSSRLVKVDRDLRGFALMDAINKSQAHSSTYAGISIRAIFADKGSALTIARSRNYFSMRSDSGQYKFAGQGLAPDRVIVITDEQSDDPIDAAPKGVKCYINNVAPYKTGLGYDNGWIHMNGFSTSALNWIQVADEYNF